MNQIRLYWSPMNRNYFSDDPGLCCSLCSEGKRIGIYVYSWGKQGASSDFYCTRCIGSIRKLGIVMEERTLIISDQLPEDASPILLRPPTLISSNNVSVFEAADKQLGDEAVHDNTKHCHNPEFMIDSDYKGFEMKLIAEKDAELNTEQGINLLDELGKAEPVLEYQKDEVKKLK